MVGPGEAGVEEGNGEEEEHDGDHGTEIGVVRGAPP